MPTWSKNKCFRPLGRRRASRRASGRHGSGDVSQVRENSLFAGFAHPVRQLLSLPYQSRTMGPESAKRALNGEGELSQGSSVPPVGEAQTITVLQLAPYATSDSGTLLHRSSGKTFRPARVWTSAPNCPNTLRLHRRWNRDLPDCISRTFSRPLLRTGGLT